MEMFLGNVNALLERGFIALEDKEWKKADDFFEQCLNQDARLAKAYLGKMMADLHVEKQKQLGYLSESFESNPNYNKIIRYGDDELKSEIFGYLNQINLRKFESIYNNALAYMARANTPGYNADAAITDYRTAIGLLNNITGYKDVNNLINICGGKISEFQIKIENERQIAEQLEAEKKAAKKKASQKRKKKIIIAFVLIIAILATTVFSVFLYKKDQQKIIAISANWMYTVALRKNGTVMAIGECNTNSIKNWEDIIAISADNPIVGLKENGTVVTSCDYEDGLLGPCDICKTKKWKNIVAISAKGGHIVGLKRDSTVVAIVPSQFIEDKGQGDVGNWKNITDISTGAYHTVGIKKDGTVVAVGDNEYGQCNVENWKDIIAISANGYNTIGLKKDGTVVATGLNDCGQCDVENWKDITAVSAGGNHTLGLKKNGTVVATGLNVYDCTDVENWEDIVDISASLYQSVGLKKDGTVIAVGNNTYGQCDVEKFNKSN